MKKIAFLALLLAVGWRTARAQGGDTYTAGGTIVANTLVKINTSNQAVAATTSDTAVPVYIALNAAASGGVVAIARVGQANCVMDATNASFASQPVYITNSTTVATDCHASTTAPSAGVYVAGHIAAPSTTSGSASLVEMPGYLYPATAGSVPSGTFQTNGTNNTTSTSQNLITSTTNSIGLTATPSNPGTNQEKIEIGGTYSGSLASGTGLLASQIPAVTVSLDTTTPITVSTTNNAEFYNNQNATAATAVTYNLPTAAAGKQFCFTNSFNGTAADTGVLTVATSASGQFIIFTDGTETATGGNVTSGGAAADAACVVGLSSTVWQLYVQRGTWTKH